MRLIKHNALFHGPGNPNERETLRILRGAWHCMQILIFLQLIRLDKLNVVQYA